MDISFDELRQKEVINISSGKKLGHIIDIVFSLNAGKIKGIVVPGDKKFFKKSEDVFISLKNIKTIGDDVVLVERLKEREIMQLKERKTLVNFDNNSKEQSSGNYGRNKPFIRYRKVQNIK